MIRDGELLNGKHSTMKLIYKSHVRNDASLHKINSFCERYNSYITFDDDGIYMITSIITFNDDNDIEFDVVH